MAFNIRRMAAASDALAVAIDNLKKYPGLAHPSSIRNSSIFQKESKISSQPFIMRARMDDDAAANVTGIFARFTCSQCGRVGRACQCKKAEAVV